VSLGSSPNTADTIIFTDDTVLETLVITSTAVRFG